MTTPLMGRQYIDEAAGRMELVRIAMQRGLWAAVVREAQECVELFLKGALRLLAVEPARTHDVAEILRREAGRFPAWMGDQIDSLAAVSTEMAGDRGVAFYGDERMGKGPQELFDEKQAARAVANMDFVAGLCLRLVREIQQG